MILLEYENLNNDKKLVTSLKGTVLWKTLFDHTISRYKKEGSRNKFVTSCLLFLSFRQ